MVFAVDPQISRAHDRKHQQRGEDDRTGDPAWGSQKCVEDGVGSLAPVDVGRFARLRVLGSGVGLHLRSGKLADPAAAHASSRPR